MSIKFVNSKLKKYNVELVKGQGYMYFIFDDGEIYSSETVMVPYFNCYSSEEWVNMGVNFYNEQVL